MPRPVLEACLSFLERARIPTLDITGGAPELHPDFREVVARAAALGAHVTHRCNLTAILLPNYADIPALLAARRVEVIASLPYYQARETDAQRGEGVFEESIVGLRRLNALGYGKGTGLVLNLVTNPVGTYLPGSQAALERDWKRELQRRHDIEFDHLYTITNMPISRFLAFLEEQGRTEEYLTRLVNAYNPRAAAGVMCRNTLSVGWDGTLYDCDFNQMLELPVSAAVPRTIFDAERAALESRDIEIGPHCFGCTAGAGSSCGGAPAGSSPASSPWGTPGPARRGGTPPAPTPPAHPRRPPSSGDCRPRSRRPRPRPIPTSQATAKRRSSGPPRRSRSPAR